MDTLQSPLKLEDEIKLFRDTMNSLTARSPAEMKALISKMSNLDKEKLRNLLCSTNVQY